MAVPLLPPAPTFPAEPTVPLIELADIDDNWEDPTRARINVPVAFAEMMQAVSRSESFAHAATALLQEVTLNATAGLSRRTQRIIDHLTATREAALRALEVGEAIAAEMGKPSG